MKRALIIVDHGSRLEDANAMLGDVAGLLGSMTTVKVYAAHMDLAEPTIGQAFDQAVADGAQHIFIFPYFLSPGRHSREDIPRMCAEAAAKHPSVEWHCSGPFGPDPMLGDLILRRMGECETNAYECSRCPKRMICDNSGGS